MKRRNHEEVYTSSTRSSPRGKRLLSWLLSMVMLLALLPATEIHVHAAYEDGMECPGCGHYHWDENCCGNCGACTRACDDDCYEETHCINDCGAPGNWSRKSTAIIAAKRTMAASVPSAAFAANA